MPAKWIILFAVSPWLTLAAQNRSGAGSLPSFTTNYIREWGTYFGGSGDESVLGSCIDPLGNIYITGETTSDSGIATPGTYQAFRGGAKDAFLVKFNPEGERLWGTYFGGESNDVGWSIAVDGTGNTYLAGVTISMTGIAGPGAFQSTLKGYNDAFLACFDSSGLRVWSTYFGGSDLDAGYTCCLDSEGKIILAGGSNSPDIIATPNAHQLNPGGGYDGFLERFDPAGQRLWGTYYGGTGDDVFTGCCCANNGTVYLSGTTASVSAISTPGTYQPSIGGDFDAFLVSFSLSGQQDWGTYFGGPAYDAGTSVAVRDNGEIYLCGNTSSPNQVASPGAHQDSLNGPTDAFLAEFTQNGQRSWSTYFGGEDREEGRSLAEGNDQVFLGGVTSSSSGISTPDGFQVMPGGGKDAYLAAFGSNGQQTWGTYYGGMADDENYPVNADSGNTVFFGGLTGSTDSIATPGSHQPVFGGGVRDGFLVRFDEVQVGIHKERNNSFSVFPNPNHGAFRITGRSLPEGTFCLDISDISGRIVYSGILTAQFGYFSQDVSVNLLPGIYLLRVSDEDQDIRHGRIIVIL